MPFSPTKLRRLREEGGPYNTREWTTERQSEVTGISVKRLETPEGVGGVGALVRGLGTHPTHDLSTRMRTPPSSHASHDPTVHSLTDPPKPDIMITPPAGEPQGPHSMTSLEDGLRFLHQDNILPQRSRENFLHLTWLPVKDKVSILLSIYAMIIVAIVSLALGLFRDFGTTRAPRIPQ
ncbi:hypothetical protein DFH94DRAFT_850433 [Russula ochroleuca]|uniref:Uncharacterized protein n=1 Tax=Russula ochroleuca TaxID=152965 RepID=A0A9P5TDT6_9AGAM|nr:hypothetical protein DFH94DRAFT_850433 [Russula ochroleuca]